MRKFNQIRAKFNNGDINPDQHAGDLNKVVDVLEETREQSCRWNEAMLDQKLQQEKEEQAKALEVVDAQTMKLDQESSNREQMHQNEDILDPLQGNNIDLDM